MKKTVMLILGVFLSAALPLAADTETIGDYTWEYSISSGTAEIIGVSPAIGSLAIPSTLGGYPVKGIGANAFADCDRLSSVTIPDGVESIGTNAFHNCAVMAVVTFGNGMKRIDENAFLGCKSLAVVTIPSGVEHIAYGTFSGCSGLTDLTIGENVKTIGVGAFFDCIGLTRVTIPDKVISIGESAFSGCVGLTDLRRLAARWRASGRTHSPAAAALRGNW